jgi:transcriptional regulator with XRE-family HTH domain
VKPEDPEDVIEAVARRIGELRAAAGLTQADVAERLQTTVSNYQRIEHGIQNLTLRMMSRIAAAIGVRVAVFFSPPERSRRRRGRPRKTPSTPQ